MRFLFTKAELISGYHTHGTRYDCVVRRNPLAIRAMSDTVIRSENLGKRYQLRTALQNGGNYVSPSFRETLTEGAQRLFGRNLSRKRRTGELWALRDVSFEVKRGEVIGIIGRNGAGKSTLLKILSRITDPTVGKVSIKGRVGSLLEVGTGFHPELTGRENIYLNGAILGLSHAEIQKKFDEIVEFAEVQQFLQTPVKHYSTGMYVRLAFAVAANLEPEIMIVDEVLSVGDAEFQKKCLGKMNEVSQREGRTVLFVSHQMNAIERLCSRALLIDKGKLKMESADVRSVIRHYFSGGEVSSLSGAWLNSGDEFNNPLLQPHRLFLADRDGIALPTPVAPDSEIWLYIDADFRTRDPAFTIGYAIYAESGEPLYRTYHVDAAEEDWPRIGRGRAVLRAKIPAGILNKGVYRLELIAALHFRQWIFEPGGATPFVFLHLQSGPIKSPFSHSNRPGFLAPVIRWETWEAK